MQEEGLVIKTMGGLAQVETTQQEACKSCGAQGMCHAMGGDKRRVITAINQVGAREGDRVVMAMPRKGVLGASFLVYMVPVAALLGRRLGEKMGPGLGPGAANLRCGPGRGGLGRGLARFAQGVQAPGRAQGIDRHGGAYSAKGTRGCSGIKYC
jgi:hypothetical protein